MTHTQHLAVIGKISTETNNACLLNINSLFILTPTEINGSQMYFLESGYFPREPGAKIKLRTKLSTVSILEELNFVTIMCKMSLIEL